MEALYRTTNYMKILSFVVGFEIFLSVFPVIKLRTGLPAFVFSNVIFHSCICFKATT